MYTAYVYVYVYVWEPPRRISERRPHAARTFFREPDSSRRKGARVLRAFGPRLTGQRDHHDPPVPSPSESMNARYRRSNDRRLPLSLSLSFSLLDLINHERAPGIREKEDVESLAEDYVCTTKAPARKSYSGPTMHIVLIFFFFLFLMLFR